MKKWFLYHYLIKPFLKKYSNKIMMGRGLARNQQMAKYLGRKRWEQIAPIVVMRLEHYIKGLMYGVKKDK